MRAPPGTASWRALCLHGYGECRLSFERLQAELAGEGQLEAFDLPGFGAAPLAGSGISAEHYLEDAAELCLARVAAQPGPCLLVGRSLGGAIALLAALAERERPKRTPQSGIAGLALIAPATLLTRPPPFARVPAAAWAALELVSRLGLRRVIAPRAARIALERVLPPGTRFDAARIEAFAVGLVRPGAWRELGAIAAAVRDTLTPQSATHRRLAARLADLPRLTLPCVVVQGELDPVVRPAEARWLAARIPGAELIALAGVGHCPENEAAAPTAAALRGLARRCGLAGRSSSPSATA